MLKQNKSKMTAARLLGFLQTDGNFSFMWDRDKTFRPRIILTAGKANKHLLECEVKPWLDEQGINSSIQQRNTEYGETHNLKVERQAQVEKLLNLFEEATKCYPTLLVDSKLVQFLALKKAFELTKIRRTAQATDRIVINQQLIDLKVTLLGINQDLSDEECYQERFKLEQILEVSDTEGKGSAIYNQLLQETNEKCEQLFQQLLQSKENCMQCSDELAQFIAGVVDGDGSYQVGFHVNSKKSQPNFAIVPMFTLTDGYVLTKKHYILLLINLFFGNNTTIQTVDHAERVYVKARPILKKIVNFSKKVGIILIKNKARLQVLDKVLQNYDQIYVNQVFAEEVIDLIDSNFDPRYRKYKSIECKSFVSKYFGFYKTKKV